ncbi:MAG: hypothetical protein LCH54_17150 [Bacteroidetes bacterium]|nr:hypothetical protein [Bacteroidota bacterium]
MKSLFLITLFLQININFSIAQISQSHNQITGEIKRDLIALLPKGDLLVDVMDSIKADPRKLELIAKFQEAIQNNKEWYYQYSKENRTEGALRYHSNLGVTEEEYKELLNINNDFEEISTGKETIHIEYNENIIRFKSQGKLAIFNYVSIDLDNYIVKIGDEILSFKSTINVQNDNNALKSKWKGYHWRLEYTTSSPNETMPNFEIGYHKLYKFSIGVIEKTGKVFIQISGTEINNGVRTVGFDLPIIY